MTFALVALLMAAVGLAATFFPARRAALMDPLVALRHL
jgi:ABC-type lipoprotein release transport system permease subunit